MKLTILILVTFIAAGCQQLKTSDTKYTVVSIRDVGGPLHHHEVVVKGKTVIHMHCDDDFDGAPRLCFRPTVGHRYNVDVDTDGLAEFEGQPGETLVWSVDSEETENVQSRSNAIDDAVDASALREQSAPPVPAQTPAPANSDPRAALGAVPAPAPARRKAQSSPAQKDITAIAKAANGAIVTIITAVNDKPIALGTGFLVSADGAIVTNYHVIRTGNVAAVKFSDGAVLPVDGLLAADKARDLAIIKIHGKNFRTLTLGNSDRIQVGEEVVAIGNPLGLELTVSNGILSGVRTVEKESGKFLQITAPISHGSSGGPLFNMSGEVIGITSMYFEGGENLNFAIPANDAKRLLLNQSATLSSLPNEPEEAEPSAKVASQTTLQKDISWMNRFLSEHSERGAVFGIKIAEPGVRDTFNGLIHDDLSGKEDCVVSVRRNATGSDWTVLMSFTDINPAKIEVFDDMMQFITLGEKQKMIIGQPGNSTFTLIPNSNFIFDSPNSAERFSQVFRHAVAFCGENQQKRVENTN